VLSTVERLDEIPGIGVYTAQAILAEIGVDMSRFPTPEHLVSWAKLCPRTIQSGPVTRAGKTGKGNPYLKGALGEAAAAAAKTNTFLGERYRRIVKRRGKLKALVAVARSILVIVWQLLANPAARFRDLGPDYHTNRIATQRRLRNHIAQLTAMGYRVTLEPAPDPKYTLWQHNPAPQAPPGSSHLPTHPDYLPVALVIFRISEQE
jgi:transposase